MRINEIHYPGSPPVDSYGPGFFRIAGNVLRGPLLLLPAGPVAWEGLPDIAAILEQAAEFDVLFMGMGAEIRALPRDLRGPLEAAGLGVEIMPTPAACRTYNVLLSEGRRVGAALMPV